MQDITHKLIHLLSEINKEELIQTQSHGRKKRLLDELGTIIEEMVKNESTS